MLPGIRMGVFKEQRGWNLGQIYVSWVNLNPRIFFSKFSKIPDMAQTFLTSSNVHNN